MTTDREVILRSLREPAAFGALFDRHARVLHRVAARRVGGRSADDVVAETFLRAFERRHRFKADRDSALPWLFGFAMNVLREQERAERRFVPHDDERADGLDAVGAVGRRVDAERELEIVLSALEEMPAGWREVVLLHTVAELGYEEIASALRIPVGTVRSRLNRARKRLRALPLAPERRGAGRGLDAAAACQPS